MLSAINIIKKLAPASLNCLCLTISIAATSCLAAPKKPFNVGVLFWSTNIPGQVAMKKGLEAEAAKINQQAKATNKRGVKLIAHIAGDGEKGMERQVKQMRQLIAQKVDIIIIQPTDNAALAAPLKEANKAGIPVIAYDQYISGGTLTSYITSDNYQAGFLDGEYISSLYQNTTPLKIILVEYPHVSSTVERVNGFLDALKQYKQNYKILKTYIAVEPVSGKQAGRAILKDFPEKGTVDVVFTVNDGGGLSVVDELTKAGRTEIAVATIDGDPLSVATIRKDGIIKIDSAQFCGAMGAQAMKTADKVLNGEKVAEHKLIPTFPITKESISVYKGWLKPIPEIYKKAWRSKQPLWQGKVKIVE